MKKALRTAAFALFAVVGIAICAESRASATSISVPNFDFSLPALAPNTFTTYPGSGNTIPDWTNPPATGVQNNSGSSNYSSVPAGPQFAYNDAIDGNTIYQDLTATLQAGVYTLTVAAGWRNGKDWPGGSIELSANGSADVLNTVSLIQPSVQGTFLDQTLTFTALPGDLRIGEPLRISLISNGPTTDFADVRLSVVPEPSSIMLLGVGAAVLFAAARRRRGV